MEAAVTTIVGKLWDCSSDAICRQFRFLCGYKDSFEKLTDEAEKLADTRERVQAEIDEARTKGEIILTDVTNWIQRVDNITKEAEIFLKEENKANKRCLKGMCIDPWSRYRFSKEAQRKIEAISNLRQEGAEFGRVSRQAPPPGLITSSALSVNFQSRESITKEIMKSLMDENVSIIGICGMGGVGKTTLVTEISNHVSESKLFDKVAMAVVSQTRNYVKIQGEIASLLGIELPDKEEEPGRARFLWKRIMEMHKSKQEREQKPELEQILIILDDVWEVIELERVGIPFGNIRRGCKIVLTSRIEDVCVEMNAKTFNVGTLPKEESWGLFMDVAGGIVDNPYINPTAREVADECGGLPLALVTVAAALKNRNKKSVWIDAKQQLKKSSPTNIKGMDQKVFASLKLSYDFLENKEQQSVFLLCCLFPEDFDIPIELLMKYGMGLRLFQEVDTVDEARCRTHTVVSALISCFLLITGNNEKHVKMHDVVRDVAIKLSKDKHTVMAKAGNGLQEWPSADTSGNLTRISLMYNDIHEVPDHGLEYPKLQALLLQQNSSLVVSNNFFQGMEDLKVLDMSRIWNLKLPRSLPLLAASLTTLCFDYCMFGDEADISLIGKLINLEFLSLRGTNIMEIPGDFGQLVNLRLFDLKYCKHLNIPKDVISCLKKLEEWYINDHKGLFNQLQASCQPFILHAHAEEDGVTILLRSTMLSKYIPTILQLQSLEKLEACYCDSMVYVFDFEGFVIAKGETIKFLSSLQNLCLMGLPEMMQIWKGDAKLISLCNLRWILLQDCSKLRQVFPPALQQSLSSLEQVVISSCDSLEEIFGKEEEEDHHQENEIVELKIEHITTSQSFGKLTLIHISDCNKLNNLFTPSIVKGLVQLSKLEVELCRTMEEIVSDEKAEAGASTESITFPSLKSISLGELGSLTCFCAGRCTIKFPSLELLDIQSCPKMETFGRGDQVTPKLNMIRIESEKRWMDNLNVTVQQFYKQ